MKIPCENCVCLAICRTRYTVNCDLLYKKAVTIIPKTDKKLKEWWMVVHSFLPKTHTIRDSSGDVNNNYD